MSQTLKATTIPPILFFPDKALKLRVIDTMTLHYELSQNKNSVVYNTFLTGNRQVDITVFFSQLMREIRKDPIIQRLNKKKVFLALTCLRTYVDLLTCECDIDILELK